MRSIRQVANCDCKRYRVPNKEAVMRIGDEDRPSGLTYPTADNWDTRCVRLVPQNCTRESLPTTSLDVAAFMDTSPIVDHGS
jgi:hypothetical protein